MVEEATEEQSQLFKLEGIQKVRTVINTISISASTGFKMCTCVVGGHPLDLIDLGAKVSIINQATYRFFFGCCQLETTTRLSGYGGTQIEVLGKVSLAMQYEQRPVTQFHFLSLQKGTISWGLISLTIWDFRSLTHLFRLYQILHPGGPAFLQVQGKLGSLSMHLLSIQ